MSITGRLATIARPSVLRLVTAGLISGAGDWLLAIALPIYVYGLTGSTLSSALTMTVELLATLVFGQFAGLVVDQFDRRVLLVVANVAQAVLLLPLLAVDGTGQLWLIYVVSGVQSAVSTVSSPAENALIPSLVAPDELVRTNTVVTTAGDVAKFIGAAAGGIVLGAVGLNGVVLVDALTFVASALLLAVRFPDATAASVGPDDGKGRLQRWREGLALVRRTREVRNCFALVLLNQLAQGIALALIVAFFVKDLHRGSAAVGVFRSFQVIGTLPAGILLAVYAARLRPEWLLKAGLVASTAVELLIWNGPSITEWFGYYLILEILLGLPGMAAFIAFITLLQSATPREFRGRVFSLMGALSSAALLVSVLVGGSLGEVFDPRTVLNATVALEALTAVAAVVLFRSSGPRDQQPAESP